MSKLAIHSNIRLRAGAYGGANSFMRSLFGALRARGHRFVDDPAHADVALLNALSDGLDLERVKRIADLGVPIVHRRVGYIVSGSPEMRAAPDGVPYGDRLQAAFDPYIRLAVFQSEYGRRVFERAGFAGAFEIVRNGVDERIFAPAARGWRALFERRRAPRSRGRLRLVVSTWSTDPNKGFADYAKLDDALGALPGVSISLVGRWPEGFAPKRIVRVAPLRPQALARFLRAQDALLTLSRFETCSNALIEGLNCGLPALYLDSGSNAELAAPYGVAWSGDFARDVAALDEGYDGFARALPDNPFRMSLVAPIYERLLERVAR